MEGLYQRVNTELIKRYVNKYVEKDKIEKKSLKEQFKELTHHEGESGKKYRKIYKNFSKKIHPYYLRWILKRFLIKFLKIRLKLLMIKINFLINPAKEVYMLGRNFFIGIMLLS